MHFAWWRHFRLQFFFDVHAFFTPFRRRRGGTELQLAARIIFALLRRAVRKQIASRREQYKAVGGEPRTRGKILWGSSVSSRVWPHPVSCSPQLEAFHQLSREKKR